MQIGQLARQAGVAVDTVRYYERCGLLAAPSRRPSGYRMYRDQDLERLRFIRRGKDLGFTLDEVRELLRLNADPGSQRSQVRALVANRLAEVERQIDALHGVRDTLADLAASCSGQGPVAGCPIIARVLASAPAPCAVPVADPPAPAAAGQSAGSATRRRGA